MPALLPIPATNAASSRCNYLHMLLPATTVLLLQCHCCNTAVSVPDELDHSRSVETQLRQQICDAIRLAEAEAHRKVEDSYQEASFAGENPQHPARHPQVTVVGMYLVSCCHFISACNMQGVLAVQSGDLLRSTHVPCVTCFCPGSDVPARGRVQCPRRWSRLTLPPGSQQRLSSGVNSWSTSWHS